MAMELTTIKKQCETFVDCMICNDKYNKDDNPTECGLDEGIEWMLLLFLLKSMIIKHH